MSNIHFIRGVAHWAKVIGDPVPNYNKDGHEWVFDLALDKDGVKQVKALKKLTLKNKDDERGDFITFKQKYERIDRATGETKYNNPIRIVDANGKDWDGSKLGNGTVVDVKFELKDYGVGKYPGIYPRTIRVLKHVPYESNEFPPLTPDDEFFKAPAKDEFRQDFGLSDEDPLDDPID